MMDWLLELKDNVDRHGIRWGLIFTLYAIFRRERRNHLLNLRDHRYEAYFQALLQNDLIIMDQLGVGDKWKDGPKFGFKPTDLPNLRRFFLLLRKVTKHQKRRMSMLVNLLKANLSKKLLSAFVSIGVVALNQKFNLNLSESQTELILGLSLAHISLQTIIDSVKAWGLSKASTIVHEVVPLVQGVVERAIVDPNTTYKELFPTIKTVHEGINKLLADVQKNDASDAFKDAASAYLSIMDIIKSIEQPKPLPEIQQESA